MKTNKQRTSEIFKSLEKHIGSCKVWTANAKKGLPIGLKNFVDHLIVTPKYIVFIEDKFEGDKIKDGQKNTAFILSNHASMHRNVHYYIIHTAAEAERLRDRIISRNL